MYFVVISAWVVSTSVAVPIHVNAQSKIDSPKDRLRNPFDYALPVLNPQSSGEPQLTTKRAQQASAQLGNWQITDLVLVGTIARAGVFQGLVKDPHNRIHVIRVGDLVTNPRFKVAAVKAEEILFFSEPFEPSHSSWQLEGSKFANSKNFPEQYKQPKDNRDAWVSLRLRPDVMLPKEEH